MRTQQNSGGIGAGVAVFSRKNYIISETSQDRLIGPKLLLITNGKLRTRFRLVPKSTTLKGHYALCFKMRASFAAHHEHFNEDRPILSAAKM